MNKTLEEFLKNRPIMSGKYEFPGTFEDFAGSITKSVKPQKEKKSMRNAVMKEAGRILSKEISLDRLEDQLANYPIISYADHHGLLNYKLLYNSNILYSEIVKELKLPFAVVFATGNIPLKNTSYPRGFYFKNIKFNFFQNKQRHIPVYLLDSQLRYNKEEGVKSFILNFNKENLSPEEKKFLEFLFLDCLEIEKAAENYETFSDQVTFLNFKLWKYFFDKSIRESTPDIVYLQSNQIVLSLLIDEINKEDSLISLILFDPEIRKVFLKKFFGIQGCWGDNMGSYFFWGITEKKKFFSLHFEESSNLLVGQDFSLKLEKGAVIDALKARKISPTLFFDFLIITFLEGCLALGGFNQVEFLTRMQQAHIKRLRAIRRNDLAEQFASRVTDGLVCGMFPFDFAGGIDLIWHYNSRNGKFNGNLDHGLTQRDLDRVLNMKVKGMISSAVETMLENV